MLGGKWVLPFVMATFHALWFSSVDEEAQLWVVVL
jgi:hypothetical protein